MYDRILVSIDSSTLSRRTLTLALELAQNTGAKLTVLYVNQITLFYYGALGPGSELVPFENHDYGEDILNAILADLAIRFDFISKRIATGNPSQLIVTVAVEEKADIIVMGNRGFGLLMGLLLGSVSRFVIKNAPCPVLIVK
ncbi:MAG: hypothetical protein APF81_03985 [Desulfosporosinus sp. BRH_c37]|nr:MAG: hypothetical protein APF81_03985 [Desulfosporosinus sp. BRH_c37]